MAAATPGYPVGQEEIVLLRAENAELRERIAKLEAGMDELSDHLGRQILELRRELNKSLTDTGELLGGDIVRVRRDVKLLQKKEVEGEATTKHVDEIIAWLDAHPERKGMNNKEAAKAMNVTRARVSQIKPLLALDGRLKITRKHISFA